VLAVYLFVQGGLANLRNPLVIPFRAWSYLYPLGMATAGFAHAGPSHLVGNLLGTVAFAPIVEYAISHYPTARGTQSFSGLRTNPFARVFAVPLLAVGLGLVTSLFTAGFVIGFSGVVFAFAGFALVSYPLATVVAVAASDVLNVVYNALNNPLVGPVSGGPQYVSPWFAGIAIQGHVLGLLLGVFVGCYLAHRRGRWPSPGTVWLATAIFAAAQSLWALYVPLGSDAYVLLRAPGTLFLFVLAGLLTAAVAASDRTLLGTIRFEFLRRLAARRPVGGRLTGALRSLRPAGRSLPAPRIPINLGTREAALAVLIALAGALALAAVPYNLVTVEGETLPDGVEVGDYTVTYAEDTPNQYISAIDVTAFGVSSQVNASGVIVVNEDRHIFQTAVSESRLAFDGESTVVVGGVTWRREVVANRTTWSAVGNESTYTVFLRPPDGERRLVYRADPVTVQPRIADRRIRIRPTADRFEVVVRHDDRTTGTAAIPRPGANATAGTLTFNRTGSDLFAERGGTRVKIATRGG
jgi:membrane associated rhomboid family serine protease